MPTAENLPNYRSLLKNELASRRSANPRYSLRAFARDLGIVPSRLSEILAGKQGVSVRTAERFCVALGMGEEQRLRFQQLVMASDARSKAAREQARLALKLLESREEQIKTLQEDSFQLIAQWYHYGILELVQEPDFRPELGWLAEQLGITATEVEVAVQRLQRLGLLEAGEKGKRWRTLTPRTRTTMDVPSEAIRNAHRAYLQKASEAVVSQPVQERDYSAMVFRLSASQLPAFKEKFRKFRQEVLDEAGMVGRRKRKDVYCLGMQLFRLSQRRSGK